MKKIFYLLTLLPMLNFAQTEPSISVNVGIYQRDCISGVGFCTDNMSFTLQEKGNATLIKKSSNELAVRINSNQFSEREFLALKNEAKISVAGSQDLIIDPTILSRLNISTKHTKISRGTYPVEVKQNYIEITFILVQNTP